MNILLRIIPLLLSFVSAAYAVQPSIYNDARVIYHAIGPEVPSELEGIDPSQSIDVMEKILGEFVEYNELPEEMRGRIQNLRKSLSAAKSQYLSCISLVERQDDEKAREIAGNLSQEVETLFFAPSQPSLLFVGGYYAVKNGSLGGHAATYEVFRQENGFLSFAVNNTLPDEIHHKIDGDQIRQLVYTDLQPADLDTSFWENVIRTNYMNSAQEKLMDSFYNYLNAKLLKDPNNQAMGRSYKKQKAKVCAWKSISVWLHGNMVKGDASEEQIYLNFKKFLFETLLAHFHPDESVKATVQLDSGLEPASLFLKTELERKIEELRSGSDFSSANRDADGAAFRAR